MNTTNQLPPLPPLQPGGSHMESLIEAAIQGHASTREAMRWLVRQLVPMQARAQVQGEPVLFIHPATFSMNQAHVGAWKPGYELPGYLPLYTTPQPAQATQAEVTDQLIESEFQQCGGKWNGDQWVIEDADLHPFCRAILALHPERVPMIARSLAEWNEDDGYAMWWAWNGDLRRWAGEPAYIGSPLCDDWPGYHTHWTKHPGNPCGITAQAEKETP